jgi:hypothetical protein
MLNQAKNPAGPLSFFGKTNLSRIYAPECCKAGSKKKKTGPSLGGGKRELRNRPGPVLFFAFYKPKEICQLH